MSIADEVRAVLQEVGSAATVRQPNGVVSATDYIDDNSHSEHTNPSVRAFFIDLNIQHPTQVTVGSTVSWGTTELLITSMSPQMFENEVVEYVASGYIVNTRGSFWEPDQEADPDTDDYDSPPEWAELYTGLEIRGTIMDRLYRSAVKAIAKESMDVTVGKLQMYISDYFSLIAMGMQWRSQSGRVYRVEHIEDHNFPGIRAVFLTEETRK